MKNFKKLVIFTVIVVCLVTAIQYLLDTLYIRRSTDKISLLMKHQIDSNIIIFGSSIAYHNIDPTLVKQQTNQTTYNMGWDGTFFEQYIGLIQEYISYEKNSKCIVIASDFDNLGKNDQITRPDLYYAYLSNDNIYNSLASIDNMSMLKAKYIPGYKLSLFNKNFYTHILQRDISKFKNGFAPVNQPWEEKAGKPFNAKCSDTVFQTFKSLSNEITKKGIKLVIVMTPIYIDGYKLILNVEKIKDLYKSIGNENITFLDYTIDSNFSTKKEYFYNYSHLNAAGAQIFSEKFGKDLNKILNKGK